MMEHGASGVLFGFSVAIDGDTVVVGSPLVDDGSHDDEGSVYVYTKVGGTTWQ